MSTQHPEALTSSKHGVRIHIDRVTYESPTPTTGRALYALANIPHDKELFLESDDGDDKEAVVNKNDALIDLRVGDHFYSQREWEIIVNTRRKLVAEKTLSYAQVGAIAFPDMPVGTEALFTINYRKGPRKNPEGEMSKGTTVKIKNGMIIDVTPTNKS